MRRVLTAHKAWLALTILFKLLIGGAFVLVPISLQVIVDSVDRGSRHDFKMGCVMVVVFFLVVFLLDYGNRVVQAKYMEKTLRYLKGLVFRGLMREGYSEFSKENTSTYISNLTNDINLMDKNYFGPLLETVGHIAIMIGSMVALIYYNPIISLWMIITAFAILTLPKCFGKVLSGKQGEYSRSLGSFTSKIKDIFLGYEVIETYGTKKNAVREFDEYNKKVENKNFKSIEAISRLASLSTYFSIMTEAVAIGLGGYYVLKGVLKIGSLFAIVALGGNLVSPMEEIAAKFTLVASMKEIKNKLIKMMNIKDEEKTDIHFDGFKNEIAFKDASFGYEDDNRIVIDGMNLRLEKGKKYVIVGSSGSGKSTLIKLLLRYYDLNKGSITLDGTDVKRVNKNELYDLMAVIHQNVYMFDETLRENITLGREYTEEELERALRDSGVNEFLDLIEGGLDGSLKESGGRLSGGQRQRVAIARALLKRKPIMLLDEATSSLDAKNSYEIERTILDLEELTVVAVSHRLVEDIMKRYDEIIVMDQGKVIEKGSFDALIEKKDAFYRLYTNSESIM